ncbi:hypothetical protein CKY12_13960 [Photorhabdus sp. S12-55]|uniref:Uncharacterized protein n=1 Tax=Photorhabdus laumondii subsp. clarkei TaxID=2029685 RepID=A0A329VMH8_9GAMM|nr:hypothetical protein A4R40_09830 [Photorhabdus laumondii subsp. laumondii]PQQ36717.1 hypothetical protein C6H68_17805 [Photorhabdus luminescens]RAW68931.1 hypothetical protein CKY15_15540 [Photorhabdus sp. S7-51]RAW70012.1 hypothetical protein CKY14_15715 [Photorhabdus sp. S14-60]RAW76365.1 hypothetical protein CKY06_16005 [Photorhabdus sp. S15-56]RAW83700.1 hypothetical protein CKY12_13960 [Photorhabdus sp. S12-55]RAW83792.1 hypothetical protein CKY09_13690 [Photorhabdus sp. S5P8-50]RAW9
MTLSCIWNGSSFFGSAFLREHGQAIDVELLQCLSPLGWEHINLTGDDLWRSSAKNVFVIHGVDKNSAPDFFKGMEEKDEGEHNRSGKWVYASH